MEERVDLAECIGIFREEERPIAHRLFQNETLTGEQAEKLEFCEVTFRHCRFLSCDFSGAYFEKTVFEDCDLSNCDLSGSYWRESTLCNVKAQGTKLVDAMLRKCRISACRMDYANLQQAALEDTRVEDTSFVSAFWSEMKLKRVVLERNRFESTDFFKTSLRGMDVSGCELIKPLLSEDLRELRGAKMSALQAVEVAAMMGIIVV